MEPEGKQKERYLSDLVLVACGEEDGPLADRGLACHPWGVIHCWKDVAYVSQ